jgi:hypothetical protein
MATRERESRNDVIIKIVAQHSLATPEQIQDALERQQEYDEKGQKQPLEGILYELGFLEEMQAKSITRSQIYYSVRKKDKLFGKIAVQSNLAEPEQVEECLNIQKERYNKEHRLARIARLLVEKGYLTALESDAILSAMATLKKARRESGKLMPIVDAEIEEVVTEEGEEGEEILVIEDLDEVEEVEEEEEELEPIEELEEEELEEIEVEELDQLEEDEFEEEELEEVAPRRSKGGPGKKKEGKKKPKKWTKPVIKKKGVRRRHWF